MKTQRDCRECLPPSPIWNESYATDQPETTAQLNFYTRIPKAHCCFPTSLCSRITDDT
uniref:Uncharacterized protein n=1 Tax=Anguilla anguilla TaxID=7936 RepID=A0A0E9WB39_ANGAN